MKWYDSILQNVKSLLGLDAEATEQEVDQALRETETRENLTASIREELEGAQQEQVDQLTAQLQEAQENLETATARITELEETVATQTATITELQERVPDEHTAVKGEGPSKPEPKEALDPITEKALKAYERRKTNKFL